MQTEAVIASLERASAEIQVATDRLRCRNSIAERELQMIRIKKRLLKTDEMADELEALEMDRNLAYDLLWAEVVAELEVARDRAFRRGLAHEDLSRAHRDRGGARWELISDRGLVKMSSLDWMACGRWPVASGSSSASEE